ncbi:NAD(P)H-binding protein [Streptomyces sp. NPDC090798]|uniref:NmrA family NAD(P)-binding protein n=1 Tax=Streptomyces sp. NPDC090798 TaxID=3365968 RepID=UPI003827A5A2
MIVITAPTGQIGHQVLDNVLDGDLGGVLDGGESVRVIARDPARLSPRVRERVEVVTGSHGDPDVVDAAFAGADSVFWLAPPNPGAERVEDAYVGFSRPACEAFRSRGVRRVVGISALGRGVPGNAGLVSASLAMDDLIAGTGVGYRALTMPSFMDNMLRQVESIKNQGLFFQPVGGNLKAPTCATRDIAAVAAGLLLDHSWSGQGEVPALGPEDLSFEDMARIMSEVLGKPVRFQYVPVESFRDTLRQRGMSEAVAQGMADMMTAKDRGLDNAEPRTPQATTPTTFRQWCEEILKPAVLA